MKGLFSGLFWKNSQRMSSLIIYRHNQYSQHFYLLKHLTSILYQDSFSISTSFTLGHHSGQSARSNPSSILGVDLWGPARTLIIGHIPPHIPYSGLFLPIPQSKIFMFHPHIYFAHTSWYILADFPSLYKYLLLEKELYFLCQAWLTLSPTPS